LFAPRLLGAGADERTFCAAFSHGRALFEKTRSAFPVIAGYR